MILEALVLTPNKQNRVTLLILEDNFHLHVTDQYCGVSYGMWVVKVGLCTA